MKTIKITALLMAIIGTLTSCQKSEVLSEVASNVASTVSSDDIASVVQYATSSETGGLSTTLTTVGSFAYSRNNASYCGKGKDTTATYSKTSSGGLYSYSYTQNWSWSLNCSTAKLPSNLSYKSTLTGQYKAPKTTSNDKGDVNFTISGLEVSSPNYKYAGSYTRNGTQSVSVLQAKDLTTTINMTITDIQVNKSTLKIQSGGKATFTLDAKNSLGKTVTYTGTILFNGDGTATITLNGAANSIKQYTVNV
jgi:hypothetical protein